MEKTPEAVAGKCPHCGEAVTNLNINYCPRCRNMLWARAFRKSRTYR